MRNPSPRQIDVSRAKRSPGLARAAAARRAQPPARPARPAAGQRPAAARPVQRPAGKKPPELARQAPSAKRKKKLTPGGVVLRIIAAMLCVVVLAVGGVYTYVSHMLNAGNESVNNDLLTVETPPELTEDKMNILVLGLDYTESDSGEVQRSKENPQADMILYVQYDKTANTIRMLQIPRDSYVGDAFDTGGTGKINATFAHGPNKDNKIQNVVEVINSMFQLQVDHWITIDMESLREMVEVFGGGGGIPVNVPYDMVEYDEYGNVMYQLPAGMHSLKGDDLEFFLRARKADGMNRGDIDRLDNQKIFYSALFNYMRTMSWQEMVKLMPFFLNYVETDISPLQCAALGVSVLGVPNENITMGTLPVILNQSAYYGSSQVVPVAIPETAVCLNAYFRPAEAPVSEDLLNIPVLNGITEPVVDCEMKQIGSGGTVTDAPAETAETADSTSGAQAGSGAAAPAA